MNKREQLKVGMGEWKSCVCGLLMLCISPVNVRISQLSSRTNFVCVYSVCKYSGFVFACKNTLFAHRSSSSGAALPRCCLVHMCVAFIIIIFSQTAHKHNENIYIHMLHTLRWSRFERIRFAASRRFVNRVKNNNVHTHSSV